ncbi:hypothetical protein ACU6U9_11030 [Pseudomonas sp. HK3]
MMEAVPEAEAHKYGVVDLQGAEIVLGENKSMEAVVETPKREEALSYLAVVGCYVLSKKPGIY